MQPYDVSQHLHYVVHDLHPILTPSTGAFVGTSSASSVAGNGVHAVAVRRSIKPGSCAKLRTWSTVALQQEMSRKLLPSSNAQLPRISRTVGRLGQPAQQQPLPVRPQLFQPNREARIAQVAQQIRDNHDCTHPSRWSRYQRGYHQCEICLKYKKDIQVAQCRHCYLVSCYPCRRLMRNRLR